MIALGTAERPLDTYARETLQRLPLADAALSLWADVLQPTFFSASLCGVSRAEF
jgi:hypothetical protein